MTAGLSATVAAPSEPSTLTFRSVAVVMPVRADDAKFRRALHALATADPRPDELIVVCDGHAPGAAAAARDVGARVIERPVSSGPAVARNAGARAAQSDLLLFIDADVEVRSDLIARVRNAFASEDVDAVFGCYDARPPEPNFLSQYKNLLQRYVHLHARREGTTFWGACGAMRRDVFVALGGFDGRFTRPSVEDIDLGYRLRAAGGRIRVRPDLAVTHLKRWTLGTLVQSDVVRRAIPWTWLLMRESAVEPDLNLRYSSRIAGALSAILAMALAAAFTDPRMLGLVAMAAASLGLIDRRLWMYFQGHHGAAFATRAILWHWVYYFYSTTALAFAVLLYPFIGRQRVRANAAATAHRSATEIVNRS